MKKWLVGCILVLGFIYTQGTTVAAELKVPKVSDTVGILEFPAEKKESHAKFSKINDDTIYLPESDVASIKKIQTDYQKVFNNLPSGNKFSVNPILINGNYLLGSFAPGYQEGVANQINFYRTLADLKSAPYSKEAMEFTQHGSIGMASVRKQTHNLINENKPTDMPQAFWNTATEAASSSQIHSSFKEETFTSHINGFFTDYGSGNKSTGHRTWLLGMSTSELGAGYAKANGDLSEEKANYYTSVYTALDYPGISGKYANDFITQWPTAGHFPIQLYNQDNPYASEYYKNSEKEELKNKYEKNMRWSVHFNEKTYKILNNASVTVKNNRTNVMSDIKTDNDGGEVTVTNAKPGYYAAGGFSTLTFRPNNKFELISNDIYTVSISGLLKDNLPFTYSYSTRFIDMEGDYQVEPTAVAGISVSPSNITLEVGESQTVTGNLIPKNATNKGISWSSNDITVATVSSSGVVTGKSVGSATITAKADDGGKTSSSNISVKAVTIPVMDIAMSPKNATLKIGDTQQLIASITPQNATNNKIGWSSSDEKIAKVNENGLVTAQASGLVAITATTDDGYKTATTQVTVTNAIGVFGTVPWEWEDTNQTLTFRKGNFPSTGYIFSQFTLYNMRSEIENSKVLNGKKIKKIVFTEPVKMGTNASYLFYNLTELEVIENAYYLDVSATTNMMYMFTHSGLKTADLSNWNTSNVSNMNNMFSNTKQLTELNIPNWNTSNVSNMNNMFSSSGALVKLNAENWDVSNVINMERMFMYSNKLRDLNIKKWNTPNVTNMNAMFCGTSSLTELDIPDWDTSKVTTMESMFSSAIRLKNLDVSGWNTSNVVTMKHMFSNTTSLTKLNVSNWDTSNVTTLERMFDGAKMLNELDVSNWNTSKVENMYYTFSYATSLTSLDVSRWDLSRIKDMSYMFWGASSLEVLDVSNWDTSNIENMSRLFAGTASLTKLDVTNWDTSKVTRMDELFESTSSLTDLDVSNWNTSNVINIGGIFKGAASLTELELSNWDTSKMTGMSSAFEGTKSLSKLNVKTWNTSNVRYMRDIFSGASSLTELDISSWDTSDALTHNFFKNAASLNILSLGEKTRFTEETNLPENKKAEFTGRWKNDNMVYESSTTFLNEYDGEAPGTYVREQVK